MKGNVRRFCCIRPGRRSHAHQVLTAEQIAASDELRAEVVAGENDDALLARVAGCTRATIRAWLERRRHLAPRHCDKIRSAMDAEDA